MILKNNFFKEGIMKEKILLALSDIEEKKKFLMPEIELIGIDDETGVLMSGYDPDDEDIPWNDDFWGD